MKSASRPNSGRIDEPPTAVRVWALPPITALDGSGSDGLILRQSYTVTQVRGHVRTNLGTQTMYAVPSNAGPLTMPNYQALAAQGIYPLANGGKVFAGQRDETFYIDLGAVFDTLNLRRTPPLLTAAEDANDAVNPFGNDTLSGFNISTIAIEVPIASLTSTPVASSALMCRRRGKRCACSRIRTSRIRATWMPGHGCRFRGWRIRWSTSSSSEPIPKTCGTRLIRAMKRSS
jgi:hypothetical protein